MSGYLFNLAGGPVCWSSRKQRTTATSSTEAEYVAQCGAAKEAVYLRQFLNELGRPLTTPTTVYADNTGAIALAQNPTQSIRSRHIDFQYHYTREKLNDGTIVLEYTPTDEMIADGMTKALAPPKFARFREQLGMKSLSALHDA